VPFSERPAVILLVDDTDAVRNLMVRLLKRVGYRVLEASSGNAALEAVETETDSIDLLLTDISLPDMSGVDLARKVQAILPEIKTLFVSGRGDVDLGDVQGAFLSKPFAIEELMGAVRGLVDRNGEPKRDAGEKKQDL
jgi:two-component system cell cycle sensor histidine kinase/response regulator CckA